MAQDQTYDRAFLDAALNLVKQLQASNDARDQEVSAARMDNFNLSTQLQKVQADLAQARTDLYDPNGRLAVVETTLTGQATDAAAAAQQAAQNAEAAMNAANSAGTPSGQIDTYYQSDAPITAKQGDIWVDTDTNVSSRFDGTTWQTISDTQVSAALAAAQSAQATADGKISAFYQPSMPSSAHLGDLWFNTGNKNLCSFCSNENPLTWTPVADGRIDDAVAAAQAAQQAAVTAQSSASGKNQILWSQVTPTQSGTSGKAAGDTWYQYQIVNNTMKILAQWQWDGSSWKQAALSETFLPQVNIGTGTYGELDGLRLKAASVQANTVVVPGSVGNVLIANGAVDASKIQAQSVAGAVGTFVQVAANQILSGELTATVSIKSDGIIQVGDTTKKWLQLDKDGMSIRFIGADGSAIVGTRLGSSDGSDSLTIADTTGNPTATISPEGDVSASSFNSDNDIIVGGTPIVGQAIAQDGTTFGWLDSLPQGIVQGGYGDFTGLVAGNGLTNTSATLGLLTVDCEPGRVYRFTMPVAYYVRNNSSADITCKVTAFYTIDSGTPSDPTTSSSPLAIYASNYSKSFSYITGGALTAIYNSPATTPGSTMKILLVAQVNNAEMDFSVTDDGQWKAWVEDLGPTVTSTARVAAALSGQTATTNGSTTDSSKLVEKRTFTTTWVGSAAQIYGASSGNPFSFSAASTGNLGHGSYDGTSAHNMRSAVVFNNTAISGESVTMPTALNGATITKAQIFVYFQHWYNSTGGTVYLHPLKGTSIPSTLSSVDSATVSQNFTARGQGAWITVPTSWFSSSSTGIVAAPPNASTDNYGYFSGPNSSNSSQRIQVRLTYTR